MDQLTDENGKEIDAEKPEQKKESYFHLRNFGSKIISGFFGLTASLSSLMSLFTVMGLVIGLPFMVLLFPELVYTLVYEYRFPKFLLFSPRLSWMLADPSLLINPVPYSSWLNQYFTYYYWTPFYSIFQKSFLLLGATIFLLSFGQMALWKVLRKKGICKTGMYRWVRHPQHLGILIMFLPLVLYVGYIPFIKVVTHDIGILLGDIITYIQFGFFLVILSDLEEIRLFHKDPDAFLEYMRTTGFFFPRIRQKLTTTLPRWSVHRNRWVHFGLLTVLYVIIVLGFYILQLSIPMLPFPQM